MTAPDALAECLQVETSMGRVRTVKNGPRVIDIDLLDWDGETIHSPPLELPHPRIPERNFVLRPLLDIAPDWAHKISGLRGDAMLAALPDDLHLYQEQW
jgi:2-amino-4-hydroxy-6-hydroxymethyldihydropteridine diphosphokinase